MNGNGNAHKREVVDAYIAGITSSRTCRLEKNAGWNTAESRDVVDLNVTEACAEGFTLFQGYYFCRPLLLECRKIPANRSSHFQILELLQHDPLDLRQLSQLVKRNSSLTFRFLRLDAGPACSKPFHDCGKIFRVPLLSSLHCSPTDNGPPNP